MVDRLAAIDTRAKVGTAVPLSVGELGPHLTQLHNVAWAETFLCTKWHLDPSSRLATTVTGRKLGAVLPFWRGAGFPSNTMRLGRVLPLYEVAS